MPATRRPRSAYIALLAAAISLAAQAEVQLLPAGEFAARDGRPGLGQTWKLSDAQGRRIAADLNILATKTAFLFDYDHQTLHAEKNGQPAPAAGWATRFEWRPEQGLFATDVTWTEAAQARIKSGEYRYVSPVIAFAKSDGSVVGVLMASILNYPALLGMEPLGQALQAQLSAQFSPADPQESPMKLLAALAALFALPATATEDEAIAAVTTFKTQADGLKATAAKQAALSGSLLSTLGLQADASEQTALAAITTLKAKGQGTDATTATTIATLQGQLATLTAQAAERDVNELVQAALSAGKLVPAQVEWAKKQGKADIGMLKAYIDSAPVIASLQTQTRGKVPGGGEGNGEVTAEALAGKALAYQTEQAKAGIQVTTAQAVMHVNKGPAASASE